MAPQSFSQGLWSEIEDTYAAILAHPFIAGLTDGTLARDAFRFYVAQDAHYLREYARALAVAAARAKRARHRDVRPARRRGDRGRAVVA